MSTENENHESSNSEKLAEELEAAADEIMGGEPLVKSESDEKEEGTETNESKSDVSGQTSPNNDGDKGFSEKEGSDDKRETDSGSENKDDDKEDDQENEPEEYRVPDGLAPRSEERFRALVTATKEARAEIEKRDEVINGFRTMLDNTGLSNQELDNLFALGTMIKTQPEEALKALQGVVAKLAEEVGEAPPGKDPLEGFDDLRDKVDAGLMEEEDALVVANARRKQAAIDRKQEQQKLAAMKQEEQSRTTQEMEAAIQKGHDEVLAFLSEKEKDLDFEAIAPHLEETIAFASKNLDPNQWSSYIQNDYARIKRLIASSSGQEHTPLTDESNRGAGGKTPKDLDELADSIFG